VGAGEAAAAYTAVEVTTALRIFQTSPGAEAEV
jgi:hypothetical protein